MQATRQVSLRMQKSLPTSITPTTDKNSGKPTNKSKTIVYAKYPKEPSINYLTLFWPILTPPPACHTLSHIPGPPKSRSHISDPRFLVGLVQKSRIKTPCTNSLSIVRGGFVRGQWGF